MPNRITLCIDARMYQHSGIGKYLQMLIPAIANEFKVTLFGNPDMLRALHSECTIIPFTKPIYSASEQIWLPRIVPQTDLFWSPHYNVPVLPIKAKHRVTTIHDVYHLAFSKDLSLPKRIYSCALINAAISKSDNIITVSNFSKNEILKFTNAKPEKVNVIYNGVENAGTINLAAVAKYKLPEHYILFVGNVKPHKNLQVLLNAYLLLNDELRAKIKLVIAGKREGFITGDNALMKFISSVPQLADKVIFAGYIEHSDMPAIYSGASLFIFPSMYEGFGLPPLEAMSYGCPVIVSDAASMPEICGNAAVYFPSNDTTVLKDKISQLLTDMTLRSKFATTGLAKVREFSWSISAEEHINLLKKIAEK